MIKHRFDFINRYLTTFDDLTGEYTRSNVYDLKGKETQEEPFMGDFPHLLDIGIKGFCEHGLSGNCLDAGIYCYQRGADTKRADMDIKDYEAILYSSRESGIVPNITTSGFLFDEKKANITEQYCGAAAVSWYKRSYTYRAIDLLLSRQVICNLHFILSSESIYEAVRLFETGRFSAYIDSNMQMYPCSFVQKKSLKRGAVLQLF